MMPAYKSPKDTSGRRERDAHDFASWSASMLPLVSWKSCLIFGRRLGIVLPLCWVTFLHKALQFWRRKSWFIQGGWNFKSMVPDHSSARCPPLIWSRRVIIKREDSYSFFIIKLREHVVHTREWTSFSDFYSTEPLIRTVGVYFSV